MCVGNHLFSVPEEAVQFSFKKQIKSLELNELGPGRTSHNLRKKVSVIMLT